MKTNKTAIPSDKKTVRTHHADSFYLHAPTGDYTVGYSDHYWKTDNPDAFFSSKEQLGFSDEAKKGLSKIGEKKESDFREIMARVYYPSKDKITQGDFYHPTTVSKWKEDLAAFPNVDQLSEIRSYATKDLKPCQSQTFPTIIFNPGINSNAQEYENIISELVSHGYIVMALNNTFISRRVAFPDGRIVDGIARDESSGVSEKLLLHSVRIDVNYAYRHIDTLLKNLPINKQSISLMGHSLGGALAVMLTQQDKCPFQAAIALDAPADRTKPMDYDIYQSGKIPLLKMHAATWNSNKYSGKENYSGSSEFDLQANNFYVLLAPTEHDEHSTLSDHNIFSDLSTLQKHPVLKDLAGELKLGSMNGDGAIKIINTYVVQFFDHFLKNQPQPLFVSSIALSGTMMRSGQQKVKKIPAKKKAKPRNVLDSSQSTHLPKSPSHSGSSLFSIKDKEPVKLTQTVQPAQNIDKEKTTTQDSSCTIL